MDDKKAASAAAFSRVDYHVTPSFQRMTTVHTAILLWREKDVTAAIKTLFEAGHPHWDRAREWSKIEKLVLDKICHFEIPEVLTHEVAYVYKPIGWEILKWINTNAQLLIKTGYSVQRFVDEIRWTARGSIDEKETAELFLKNDTLDNGCRFRLACRYCCEDHISALWSQMPQEQRDVYSGADFYKEHRLVVFWTHVTTGEVTKIDDMIKQFDKGEICNRENAISRYEYAFKWSAKHNYEVAVEYFWHRLTVAEKEGIVAWAATKFGKQDFSTDTVVFLLSHMNGEQQRQMFRVHAYFILVRLSFDWQWRDFFVTTVEHMWEFLTEDTYIRVLSLSRRMIGGDYQEDEKYPATLRKLWQKSPLYLKRYVYMDGWNLLSKLLDMEDAANLKLVLRDASADERRKLVYCKMGRSTCIKLMGRGKTQILDTLFRAVFVLEDDISKFQTKLSFEKLDNDLAIFSQLIRFEDWPLVKKFSNEHFSNEEELQNFKLELSAGEKGVLVFYKLLCDHNWERVEKFKEFCLSSERVFSNFRKRLVKEKNERFIPRLMYRAILDDCKRSVGGEHDDVTQSHYHKLLSAIVPLDDEVAQLKNEILIDKGGAEKVCVGLLDHERQEAADVFLTWLFSSQQEVDRFKRDFMMSDVGLDRFHRRIVYVTNVRKRNGKSRSDVYLTKLLRRLLEWFRPTSDDAAQFKVKFRAHVQPHVTTKKLYRYNYKMFLKMLHKLDFGRDGLLVGRTDLENLSVENFKF